MSTTACIFITVHLTHECVYLYFIGLLCDCLCQVLIIFSESLSPILQPIVYMRYMLNWIHPFFKIHTVVMNTIMHLPGMCVLALVAIMWIECMYKGRLHLVYRYFCQVRPQDTSWSVSYSYKGNSCKYIFVVVWNPFLEHFLSITSLIQLLVHLRVKLWDLWLLHCHYTWWRSPFFSSRIGQYWEKCNLLTALWISISAVRNGYSHKQWANGS